MGISQNIPMEADEDDDFDSGIIGFNMTPWEFYIGNPAASNNTDILKDFSGAMIGQETTATPMPVNSFWIKGITGVR